MNPSAPIGRIRFPGNPWPDGHALAEFSWTVRQRDDVIWCDLHLVSQDYHATHAGIDDARADAPDWAAVGVWRNYHACTLSASKWGDGGFRVCDADAYAPALLDGQTFQVDVRADTIGDPDTLSFGLYLLGHDAAANHRIAFRRDAASGLFTIDWRGDIALAFIGNDRLEHRFEARIEGVPFPLLPATPAS